MADDPLTKYEAQAMAIQKQQQEIDRLARMNEEMNERLRRLEVDREESLNGNLVTNLHLGANRLIHRVVRAFEKFNYQQISWNNCKRVYVFAVIFVVLAYGLSSYNDSTSKQKNTILITGGNESTLAFDGMIVLSEDRTKWTRLQLELPYNAQGSGAVSLNGEIYLFGGGFCPTCLYKLEKNLEWIPLADMNVARTWITNSCLAWNGSVWVFGGLDEEKTFLKSVERYDTKEDKWVLMPDMKYPRLRAAATVWKDRIVITGGRINDENMTNTVECFYPEDGRWSLLSNMPRFLEAHSSLSYSSNLIVMGGWDEGIINDVWKLGSQKGNAKWKKLPPSNRYTDCWAGIVLDNLVYAIGGRGKGTILQSCVELFNGKQWRIGPSLPYPLRDMSAMIISGDLADRLIAYKPE